MIGMRHAASFGGKVTTSQRDTMIAAAGLAAGGYGIATRPGMAIRAYKFGVKQYVAWTEMASLLPALGPDYKPGIRYGGTGEVTTVGRAYPITRGYGPVHTLPVPDFGFGFTSVPVGSSRFYHEAGKRGLTTKQTTEIIKSRGGQARSLPSSVGSRKSGSIGSPSAQATRAPSRGRRGAPSKGRRRRAPKKCGAWNPHMPYQCVKPRGHRGRHYHPKTGSFSSNVYF